MEINDLQKIDLVNQRVTHSGVGNQQLRDGRFTVGRVAVHFARCRVAADVSRRILDDHAGLDRRPQQASATKVCPATPGPPNYVGGDDVASPCLGASPSGFLVPADVFIIHHRNDLTPVRENQKTYRRLFGMIFFGGCESMVVTALQWLATLKISKNGKNSKANSIFIFQNIDLAAKTP
jgi:hypothetical protein